MNEKRICNNCVISILLLLCYFYLFEFKVSQAFKFLIIKFLISFSLVLMRFHFLIYFLIEASVFKV